MELISAYIDNWSRYREQDLILEMSNLIGSMRPGDDVSELQNFLVDFLQKDSYNARLLLYLPFWVFEHPSREFNEVAFQAFSELLCYQDVRESYNLGDCYELDARPSDLDRVIKVVHIIPWLVRAEVLEIMDVLALAEMLKDYPVFCRSILDILPYSISHGVFSVEVTEKLRDIVMDNAVRGSQAPKYNSTKRQAWLEEMRGQHSLTFGNITGPFIENVHKLELSHVAAKLGANDIIRLGGSRVKGYGRSESDFDFYPLQIGEVPSRDPEMAHIVFNTIWVGHDREKVETEQARHARAMVDAAKDPIIRRQILEKLEQDLLQYRLLHKGFPYAYADISTDTQDFPQIDGASAFYDDRYRRVASQLFLKYVFLP